ncbi:hypothetical protein NFJ02_19g32630 [Pycnococcus provasolii]
MSELSCAHNSLNRDEYLKSQNVAENSLTLKEEAMGQTPSYSNHKTSTSAIPRGHGGGAPAGKPGICTLDVLGRGLYFDDVAARADIGLETARNGAIARV